MKKLNIMKTIQLIILIAFTVLCVYLMFFEKKLYFAVAQDPAVRMISVLLWICLVLSYAFMLADFLFTAGYKRDYRELRDSISSDPLSGLANRKGCDAIIEKYENRDLPMNLGCVMIGISNIREINQLYGHREGDKAIRDFSNILKMSAVGLCFLGRNGGNKFLAIFENSKQEQIDQFLQRVSRKTADYNNNPALHILKYGYGIAFNAQEKQETISELIALADRRISDVK